MSDRTVRSKGERVFEIVNGIIMVLIVIVMLYPFWYVLVCSFSSIKHVTSSTVVLWPDGIHLEPYRQIFAGNMVGTAYRNTIFITLFGTAVSMALTMLGAFVLSRKELPGHTLLTAFVVFTMLFGGGMVPFYLMIKNVGLLNSLWGLIFPFAISTYNMIIMRNFFSGVPNALYEAAAIDGSSYSYYFVKILLPISTPAIATITLFYAVGYWNSYFWSRIILTTRSLYPMQAVLREIIVNSDFDSQLRNHQTERLPSQMLKDAMIVITALPIIMVYPFLQRYFVKGIIMGSLKG